MYRLTVDFSSAPLDVAVCAVSSSTGWILMLYKCCMSHPLDNMCVKMIWLKFSHNLCRCCVYSARPANTQLLGRGGEGSKAKAEAIEWLEKSQWVDGWAWDSWTMWTPDQGPWVHGEDPWKAVKQHWSWCCVCTVRAASSVCHCVNWIWKVYLWAYVSRFSARTARL